MKNFKAFYFICVLWLLVVWGNYFVLISYEGLKSINNIHMESGIINFITGLSTVIVLIVYPLRIWIKEAITRTKKAYEREKRERNKNRNTKEQVKED